MGGGGGGEGEVVEQQIRALGNPHSPFSSSSFSLCIRRGFDNKFHSRQCRTKCKSPSFDSGIENDLGRGHDLSLWFFKKVRSFTPSDLRLGIQSLSSIRPICKCRCPTLLWGAELRDRDDISLLPELKSRFTIVCMESIPPHATH
jgi:hypothetical protein